MTQPAYQLPSRRLALFEAARAWIGTPFRKGVAVKAAGADCVHLVHAVYAESGFVLPEITTRYSLDGARHLKSSQVVQWIEECGRFQEVMSAEIGDVLLFKIGCIQHHVGIKITDSTFINSLKHYGVRELNMADSTWSKRLAGVYRPMEESL